MNVSLIRISKSSDAGSRIARYTTTFLFGGKRRVFHATVHTHEANAISFREQEIGALLACHMDEGRRVYQAVSEYHRSRQASLPVDLGELRPSSRARPSRLSVATGA